MNDIYLYKSSKLLLADFISSAGEGTRRGSHKRVADALRIFPSYLSLILKGDRTLNLDQAMLLADFMKLKKSERRYLFRLIELDKAQNPKLREEILAELDEISSREMQVSARIEKSREVLTLEDSARFFSSWTYSAIHLMAAVNPKLTPLSVAKKLHLSLDEVKEVFKFLLRSGLWVKKGKTISIGPSYIHIDHSSAFLNAHHRNWRLKATERQRVMNKEKEVSYSLCVALSKSDALKVKGMILKNIEEIRKVSDPSDSEIVYNLNLDWLEV